MLFTENLKRLLEFHGWDAAELAQRSFLAPERIEALLQGDEVRGSELVTLSRTLGTSMERLLTKIVRPVNKRSIKLLVLDVDGVMTEGGMFVMEDGNEMKRFHTRDGRGIKELMKAGVPVAFLSGSLNAEAIHKRAERLGVDRVYAGRQPKTGVLGRWLAELAIDYSQIAYVGDDLNDIQVIELAG